MNPVYVNSSFDELFHLLDKIRGREDVVVIIDSKVDKIYGGEFEVFPKIIIESREEFKTLETVEMIIGRLLEMRVDKGVLLLGVGGGIVCDIVGFVGSIYKRGIKFAFVPTTLLAQVDASIGGKNGVNFSLGKERGGMIKNMVGTIRLPEFVYVNIAVLKTQSVEEFYSGLGEVVKVFLISGEDDYVEVMDFLKEVGRDRKVVFDDPEKMEDLKHFLEQSVNIKEGIVDRDMYEKGERLLLNFGHTFGHAIEMEMGIEHGDAVVRGMVIAAKVSNKLGYMSEYVLNRLIEDFEEIGLPTDYMGSPESLFKYIENDKKRDSDSIKFVFIRNVGDLFVDRISINELKDVVKGLL